MNLPTRKIKFILLSQMITVDFTNEAELNHFEKSASR